MREQGVGRNKSSEVVEVNFHLSIPGFQNLPFQVTQIMDMLYGGGGDYHISYWPQPSYLSSRKYYIESTFQCE